LQIPEVTIAPEMLEGLKHVSTPTTTQYLLGKGFHNIYLIGIPPQALGEGQVMVGRARTLRFLPLREDLVKAQYGEVTGRPHRDAIESIETDRSSSSTPAALSRPASWATCSRAG